MTANKFFPLKTLIKWTIIFLSLVGVLVLLLFGYLRETSGGASVFVYHSPTDSAYRVEVYWFDDGRMEPNIYMFFVDHGHRFYAEELGGDRNENFYWSKDGRMIFNDYSDKFHLMRDDKETEDLTGEVQRHGGKGEPLHFTSLDSRRFIWRDFLPSEVKPVIPE